MCSKPWGTSERGHYPGTPASRLSAEQALSQQEYLPRISASTSRISFQIASISWNGEDRNVSERKLTSSSSTAASVGCLQQNPANAPTARSSSFAPCRVIGLLTTSMTISLLIVINICPSSVDPPTPRVTRTYRKRKRSTVRFMATARGDKGWPTARPPGSHKSPGCHGRAENSIDQRRSATRPRPSRAPACPLR